MILLDFCSRLLLLFSDDEYECDCSACDLIFYDPLIAEPF